MIIVAGAGRCGTSLMMQTLKLLGIPLVGNPEARDNHCLWQMYERENNTIVDTGERTENTKGYYELSLQELNELIDGTYKEETQGRAVKFNTDQVVAIDNDCVEAVIFCRRRNMFDQAQSMKKLSDKDLRIKNKLNIEECFADIYSAVKTEDWLTYMIMHNNMIERWLRASTFKSMTVWFEDMASDPEPIIQHLGDFLELDNPDISEALKNVDIR